MSTRRDDAGGMVFSALQYGPSLFGVGRRGDGKNANRELHHSAFEVPTLAEVIRARDRLRAHGAKIDFEGRRRAGCQIAVEFRDPDNHSWKSTGVSIRSAATAASARPMSGTA